MEPENSGCPNPEASPLTLDNIPVGIWARVSSVLGNGMNAIRLMEMGLVPGAPVSVVRSAPFGDPLQIRIRDYHLALRRGEASMVSVVVAD
jgi:ferrous iron transport protein A